MKAKERIASIIEQIPYNGFIMIKDLSDKYNVTEETIRRDLNKIVEMNVGIRKAHGGAYRCHQGDVAAPQSFRQIMLPGVKQRFAAFCSSLIIPNSCIMLDSSTTSRFIANKIKELNRQVTVVTNSIATAGIFEDSENVNVVCAGGNLRKLNGSLVGPTAIDTIERYCANCCFVSPASVDEQFGLTDHNEEEARIRACMIKQSKRRYLVVDHTKFGWAGINRIGSIDMVDMVITDGETDQVWLQRFRELGIEYKVC
ncbi:MAG: DeoR/GlpR family DNA-binding transcription regulator [Sphaerochaetaceae bacterium]|jgi:DeoR/GlpR family transcriptional regulator of sugar metabolism